MKGYIAIILLFLATAIGTYLFQQDHKGEIDRMDLLAKGLSPIADKLPLNAFIYYNPAHVDHDVFTKARYLLAPRNLVIADEEADTLLSIIKVNDAPSLLNNRKIIYQAGDSIFIYQLSIKNE